MSTLALKTAPTNAVIAGAASGLVGGAVFGMMMGMMGMLPMVGMLVGQENAVVGLIVHMLISAFIGAVYGLVATRLPTGWLTAGVAGAVNGVVWWVLGALILMPLGLGMTGRRGLWLDDLYVAEAYRGRGLGRAVMHYLAGVAARRRCARFEWLVLDWNEQALGLYRGLGARVLEDHRVCRLDEDGILALA